jgi:hypothetical protein
MGIVDKETARRRRSLLLAAIGIVLTTAIFCGLCNWRFDLLGEFPPPEQSDLQQTELILEELELHPGDSMPDDFPLDLKLAEQCWGFLQDTMARNDNQYTLVIVGVYGDYGTPTSHGANEVVINIVFSDGTRVEMYYYNHTLELCRGLTDDMRPIVVIAPSNDTPLRDEDGP